MNSQDWMYGLPYCYVIFIPLVKMFHGFCTLIFDPIPEVFPSVWSGDSLNRMSIVYSQTLLDLTSSSSSSLGKERSGMVDVPTPTSYQTTCFHHLGVQ